MLILSSCVKLRGSCRICVTSCMRSGHIDPSPQFSAATACYEHVSNTYPSVPGRIGFLCGNCGNNSQQKRHTSKSVEALHIMEGHMITCFSLMVFEMISIIQDICLMQEEQPFFPSIEFPDVRGKVRGLLNSIPTSSYPSHL